MKAMVLVLGVLVMGCGSKSVQHLFDPNNKAHVNIEEAIRREIKKSKGELTEADLGKVQELDLGDKGIAAATDLMPLAGLTKLEGLYLGGNQITDLTPLMGLQELKGLHLSDNPNLTNAEIEKLQKALPGCDISHNVKK